jgi:hypothetical protein
MATVSKAFFVLNIVRLSVTDCFFFVELFRELDGVFSADEPFAGPKIQRQALIKTDGFTERQRYHVIDACLVIFSRMYVKCGGKNFLFQKPSSIWFEKVCIRSTKFSLYAAPPPPLPQGWKKYRKKEKKERKI